MSLAIFDLDETLVAADTASLWCEWMVEQGMVSGEVFMAEEARMMQLYADGQLDMADYMAFTQQPLKGMTKEQIAELIPAYIEQKILRRVYPQGRALIEDLQQSGYRVVVISATSEALVEPIANELGVTDVLAIQLAYDDNGFHTGETRGVLTFREGKVTRLNEWLELQKESLNGSRFYSDSMNDLPLLEQVDHPVVTNGDHKLRTIAQQRNWQLLDWQLA